MQRMIKNYQRILNNKERIEPQNAVPKNASTAVKTEKKNSIIELLKSMIIINLKQFIDL